MADTLLIKNLYAELGITDITRIRRLITKTWNEKRLERVDIIYEYGVSTNDEPQVMAYEVTIDGPNLSITPLYNPHIRSRVNKEVQTWRQLSAKYERISFPGRTDLRESQRRLDQCRLRNGHQVSVPGSRGMKEQHVFAF